MCRSKFICIKFWISVKKILKFLETLEILDERNQILNSYLWMRQRWRDLRLSWNEKIYNGIKVIRLPLEFLWTPDTVLMNNVDYYKHDEKNDANLVVYSDGTIVWDQEPRLK